MGTGLQLFLVGIGQDKALLLWAGSEDEALSTAESCTNCPVRSVQELDPQYDAFFKFIGLLV